MQNVVGYRFINALKSDLTTSLFWLLDSRFFRTACLSVACALMFCLNAPAYTFTWEVPDDIVYGVALGPTQLNASASVSGAFDYAPAAGTVLDAGTAHELMVTFTPDDSEDGEAILGLVPINVTPAPLSIVANDANRSFGGSNPSFGGTDVGIVNSDSIAFVYASDAGAASPAGTYLIYPLVIDPDDRLGNYDISVEYGILTVNAGLGSIQGFIWDDANRDGEWEEGEAFISGATAFIDDDRDGEFDTGEVTASTGVDGEYVFANVAPGFHLIGIVPGNGKHPSWPEGTGNNFGDGSVGAASQFEMPLNTTGSDAPIFIDPPNPKAPIQLRGVAPQTAESDDVIQLDDFRADARFSAVDGAGYAVAILDTGADLDHPFFGPDSDSDGVADRIVFQYDFGDDDSAADDVNNHGSNVASIAASSDATYPGVAPGADIVVLKVFKDSGSGKFSYIESALQWLIANAAAYNIVAFNMSVSDGQNHASAQGLYGVDDELATLAAAGVMPIAAAGNSFFNFASFAGVGYPGADDNSIRVGAVYDSGNSGFSYGSGATASSTAVDRIAPFSQRHDILTTFMAPGAPITGANKSGGTSTMHGTSQAAPHVAGLAVLAQQMANEWLGESLSIDDFETLLRYSSDTVNDGDDENDNVVNTGLGFHRVNALKMGENLLMKGYEHRVVIVDGASLSEVNFGLQSLIISQPVDVGADVSEQVTLAVDSSDSTASFQWYQGASGDTSSPIAGARSPTLATGLLSEGSHQFWAMVTGSLSAGESVAATVTVTSSGYGSWKVSEFTEADLVNPAMEATVWGDTANPDGDAFDNLMEYALGLSATAIEDTSDALDTTVSEDGGADFFNLTFRARTGDSTIQYVPQATSNPDSWPTGTDMGGMQLVGSQVEGGFTVRTYRDSVAVTQGNPRFVRLKVIRQ